MHRKINDVKTEWVWKNEKFERKARFIYDNNLYEVVYYPWPKPVALPLISDLTKNKEFTDLISDRVKAPVWYAMEFDLIGGNYLMVRKRHSIAILGIILNTMRDLADKEKVLCYFYNNQKESANKSLYTKLNKKIGRGHGWHSLSCTDNAGCHIVWRDTSDFVCFRDI